MKMFSNLRAVALIFLAGSTITTNIQAQASSSIRGRPVTNQSVEADSAEAQPNSVAPSRSVSSQSAHGLATAETKPADSVADDLQKIVVLCATEPASEAFDTAWMKYVEQHGIAAGNLDALIDDVLERADTHRAERASTSRTSRTLMKKTTTRERMHDTAMAVIRKIG